jgi:hypothetical protein
MEAILEQEVLVNKVIKVVNLLRNCQLNSFLLINFYVINSLDLYLCQHNTNN